MQDAQNKLSQVIQIAEIDNSETQIVMNAVGSYVTTTSEMQTHMINQVTHLVFWQKGIEAMVANGIDLFIEMGPGKTLAGMNKRIGVSIPTISVEKVEDLEGVGYAPTA